MVFPESCYSGPVIGYYSTPQLRQEITSSVVSIRGQTSELSEPSQQRRSETTKLNLFSSGVGHGHAIPSATLFFVAAIIPATGC